MKVYWKAIAAFYNLFNPLQICFEWTCAVKSWNICRGLEFASNWLSNRLSYHGLQTPDGYIHNHLRPRFKFKSNDANSKPLQIFQPFTTVKAL